MFELTKQQPIGVMIHGNSQFGNLPIETIIKGFHKLSHDTQYDTVDACKDDFLKFLGKADFNVSNDFMAVRMFWYFYEEMVQWASFCCPDWPTPSASAAPNRRKKPAKPAEHSPLLEFSLGDRLFAAQVFRLPDSVFPPISGVGHPSPPKGNYLKG